MTWVVILKTEIKFYASRELESHFKMVQNFRNKHYKILKVLTNKNLIHSKVKIHYQESYGIRIFETAKNMLLAHRERLSQTKSAKQNKIKCMENECIQTYSYIKVICCS